MSCGNSYSHGLIDFIQLSYVNTGAWVHLFLKHFKNLADKNNVNNFRILLSSSNLCIWQQWTILLLKSLHLVLLVKDAKKIPN